MFFTYSTMWFILFPSKIILILNSAIDLNVWYYALSTTMVGLKIVIPYYFASKRNAGTLRSDPELDFCDLL